MANSPSNNPLTGQMLAAVDLGSNSFHMIVSRADENGNLTLIDKEKEMVRLRGGLDKKGELDPIVEERAYQCLQRFSDRLRNIDPKNVRVAGTNTLRNMRQSDAFVSKGSKLLGHPIEIVSGQEEARLVYLGVAHTLSNDHGKQLVIDIGGGSTEFIIGADFHPLKLESLDIGAASSTQRFFKGGDLSKKCWEKASLGIRLEILPIEQAYAKKYWSLATGSSGTIKTTLNVILALELERFGITLKALYSIRDRMIKAGSVDDLNLPSLSDDRKPVYAGGLAVLIAVFEALNITEMTVSDGALREGLLYDMLGRIRHEDVRDRTIEELSQRFNIDKAQAHHVHKTASHLFDQVKKDWSLTSNHRQLLCWAASLHEIGLAITHNKHHFQGAHILKYAFMPGFSKREQAWLATLVKSHRRKVDFSRYQDISEQNQKTIMRLSIMVRLAVLLHRRRDMNEITPDVAVEGYNVSIKYNKGHENRELLEADLLREKSWLKKIDYHLTY
ncbi:Ppx/GppA phosphatase family protein [Leucothrix arctica]|uniref:Exopolyphosphatase n=1 Tax=Leucothrix arctica TaxID=1481894 RepID=A0A317CJP2_9GAMM|nr:Ppx/GppA phosphatase family protein [Leucothrix arctica]PWQ98805.1 exopolyphosphatase [Leucothrix arctica]